MRSPDGVDKARLVRYRQATGRSAEDQREPEARIAGPALVAGGERSERAGVRVDEPRPDRRALDKPHFRGGFGRQSAPHRRSGLEDLRAEVGQSRSAASAAKPDAMEKLVRPAPLVRQIAELADDRAERTRKRARRAERKIVGEAQEMRGFGERLRLRPAEPGKLRRLHLGRQRAPDIAQALVAAGVDSLGVLGRSMVHPRHHVASGRVGAIDRQAA